ncbi:Dabb family protein [Fodinicurvata sp. EGI_FJ10296]|uniref:Dabb family protein n=1 Tax=Fodinicurvata sp. EGI_FJ10296 TaxID=3231908 RepID=UPI003451E019
MIRHIVFFSAADKSDLPTILDGLGRLTRIPHARRVEIARNLELDGVDDTTDVVVYGEFDDEDALAAFKAHPLYQESTAIVKPLREIRMVADIHSSS